MKENFIGFYTPTEVEINDAWENGKFVFDTNTLLNLYRYSKPTRNDFLLSLNVIKENLFLPHQIGFEFHNRRISTIKDLNGSYDKLFNKISTHLGTQFSEILKDFNSNRHPSIDIIAIDKIKKSFINKINNELKKQQIKHENFLETDIILEQVEAIFDKKMGKQFSLKELNEIYTEGKERYEHKIPPGYKDAATKKDQGNKAVYGDLIIWKEVINYSKAENKPIIFVTDDGKEDWWRKEGGSILGPRPELIQEFFELTKNRILIYSHNMFLKYAKERGLAKEIKQDSINEVEAMKIADDTVTYFQTLKDGWHGIASPYELSNYEINAMSLLNDFYKINDHSKYPVASSFANAELFKPMDNISNMIGSAAVGVMNSNWYKMARQMENIVNSASGASLAIPENFTAAASEILPKKDD